MKFLIIAFLACVAAESTPEADPQFAVHGSHLGLVRHFNGAVTPDDTFSVKAAKGQHLAAKAITYAHGVRPYTPYTYATPYTTYVQRPVATVAAPVAYTPASTYTYTHATPYTTYPYSYHSLGKREAEAEPEAEAEADPQYWYNNHYNYAATPYTYATPYNYARTYATPFAYRHAYTTPYAYSSRLFKREAEAESEAEADPQYYSHGVLPYTHYTRPYTHYNYARTYGSPYHGGYARSNFYGGYRRYHY